MSLTTPALADQYFPESDLAEGWRKNTDPKFVHSLGLDIGGVEGFGGYNLSVPSSEITGALVVKDGWIVGEWYSHPEGLSHQHYLASVGKTFALACFGIVVKDSGDGRIEHKIDRNARVYDPRWLEVGFPLTDSRKRDITFDHIFRHTSGLCPQQTADGKVVEKGRNQWTDYISWIVGRDKSWPETSKLYFTPGFPQEYLGREQWGTQLGAYSSVGFAHLGLVISEIYGTPAHEFLWSRLLEPLGFGGVAYHNPPDEPDIKWFTAGGIKITLRDFARFAYFLLRGGRWKDQQIVPSGWIESLSSTPFYPNLRSNVDGYFGETYPEDMFWMFGSGGNFAVIVPSYNLIALRTGRVDNFFVKLLEKDFLRRTFLMIPGYDIE
ncbi:MAG: serine hydrolase [Arenicellales bacterium]|nr:serine hydrolase [Arenicellales bacterium]